MKRKFYRCIYTHRIHVFMYYINCWIWDEKSQFKYALQLIFVDYLNARLLISKLDIVSAFL